MLEVALRYGIDIPSLCYHEGLPPYAACRLCIVEVTVGGRRRIVTSCTYPAREGLEVQTHTEAIVARRRLLLELLLAQAPASEALREFAAALGVTSTRFPIEDAESRCILCGLCERACREQSGHGSITFAHRGARRKVTTPFDEPPEGCNGCTACAFVCPTGAIEVLVGPAGLELEPWRAQVEMATCAECGASFAPAPGLREVAEKAKLEPALLVLCPTCRRRAHARILVTGKA